MTELLMTTLPVLAAPPATQMAAPCTLAAPAAVEFPEALFVLLTPPVAAITLAAAPASTITTTAATSPAPAEEVAADDAGIAAVMLAMLGAPVAPLLPTALPPASAPEPSPLAAAGPAPAALAQILPSAARPAEKTPVPAAPITGNSNSTASSPASDAQIAVLAASVADGATRPEGAAALPRVDAWLPPAPTSPTTTHLPAAPPVTVAPTHPEFAERFASSVLWSAGQKLEQAEIQLHPRELGPVSVSLSMRDDQASITFSAAHPAAREAITQALPLLRDMFAVQGMNLAQAQVFDQPSARPQRPAAPSPRRGGTDQHSETLTVSVRRSRRVGLLDDYA